MKWKIKDWWKRRKYWQKGAVIGFLFGIFIILLMFGGGESPYSMTIGLFYLYFIPYYFGGLLAKIFGLYSIGAAITILPSILFFYSIIGIIIGLIVNYIKKNETKNFKNKKNRKNRL